MDILLECVLRGVVSKFMLVYYSVELVDGFLFCIYVISGM